MKKKRKLRIDTTLCYIEQDGKYLMLNRNKKEDDYNEGKWIGVGGKFLRGETPDECLLREVREETGLTLTDYKLRGVIGFVSEAWEDITMYLYTATGFEGELISDCEEGELVWIDKDKIMDLPLWEGDKFFLPRMIAGEDNIKMTLYYDKDDKLVKVWCGQGGLCGGCMYEAMSYEEQLALKDEKLRTLLKNVSDGNVPNDTLDIWEGTCGSPLEYGYKNKMEYSFGDERLGGDLTLGMHRKKSFYSVLNCDDCRLVHPDYNIIVDYTVRFFRERGITYYHKNRHDGVLRHLLLRRSFDSGDILVDIVTATPEESRIEAFEQILSNWKDGLISLELEGQISGVLHTTNNALADAVIDEGTKVLYGQDYFYEKLLGLSFKVTPFSFFQTNSAGAEVLYSKVREYLGDTKDKVVYDLYCGTGTIAQITSPAACKVLGVEIIPEAVEAAKANAALNGLSNCEFIAGDVFEVLKAADEGGYDKPDVIILDPPRDGLHPKMLPVVCAYGVDRIVYVACKPESFVRDFEYFREKGYKIEKACGVDMFPWTRHCEMVCLLSKVNT